MLLQSHDGEIRILPVLPEQWRKGFITGLRARGNFTVDIYWKDLKLDYAVIHSKTDGKCKLRIESPVVISSGDEIIDHDSINDFLIEFNVLKNKSYKIIINNE